MMRKRSEKEKMHSELVVALVIVLALGIAYRFVIGNYAAGLVVSYLNESSVDVPVDQEVDEKINLNNEADVIIEFENRHGALQSIESLTKQEFREKHRFQNFNGISGRIDKDGLKKLRKNPNVKRIYYDKELRIDLQDSTKLVNATNAWSFTGNITGRDAVCILDTGIDYNHNALSRNFLAGYDYVNMDNDAMDDNGHGSHVAGIVAGNGSFKGVAPSAKIVMIKVCNAGGGCSVSDVSAGIEYCNSKKDEYKINVITMSLGGGLYISNCDNVFPSITTAVNAAVGNNIVVFAASGNSGSVTGIAAPACIKNIIAVGGSDKNDGMYSNGNRNSLIGVIAPATSITSSYLNNGVATLSGTSMATPHAAAVANLLYHYASNINKSLTTDDIRKLLKDNGKQIYDAGSNMYYSRVNIYAALLKLKSSVNSSKPIVNAYYPENNSIIMQKNIGFIFGASDDFDNSLGCWISIDNNNYNVTANNNANYTYSRNILDGIHTWNAGCVDSTSNIGRSNVINFSVDAAPIIAGFNPIGIVYGNNTLVNVTTDENSNCKASFNTNNTIYNMNLSFNGSLMHYYNFNGYYGNYSIYVGCQDNSNKTGYSNWQFSLASSSTSTSTIETTTTVASSGGSSSGGGGGSSSREEESTVETSIFVQQQETSVSTVVTTSSVATTIAATPVGTGFVGFMGNVVKNAGENAGTIRSIAAISIISLGYFVFRRYGNIFRKLK